MKTILNLKKYLWVVGVALFLYVSLRVDWPSIVQIFKQAKINFLLLSFALVVLMLLLKTLRWKIFVDLLGVKVALPKLFVMVNKSVFWAIATPGRIGEFSRAKYLADVPSVSLTQGIWTVGAHKTLDILDTCFLGALSVLLFSYIFSQKVSIFVVIGLLAIFVVFAVFYLLIKKEKGKWLFRLLFKLLIPGALKPKAEVFFSDLVSLTKKINWQALALSFFYELLQVFILAIAELLIVMALGISVPFWFILLVIPLFDFIVSMPISILGIGVREAGYGFFFSFLGLGLDKAVAFSLMLGLWTLANALPGFLLYLFEVRKK